MTVICYRDGIMAADCGTIYGSRNLGGVKKIARSADGNLAGSAGDSTDCEAFRTWFAAGGPKETIPKLTNEDGHFDAMIATSDGRLFMMDGGMLPILLTAPFYAIGSGAGIATGAMYMGASAEEAVRAAIDHDCYCFGPVQVEAI